MADEERSGREAEAEHGGRACSWRRRAVRCGKRSVAVVLDDEYELRKGRCYGPEEKAGEAEQGSMVMCR